jgi:hypothetical protein
MRSTISFAILLCAFSFLPICETAAFALQPDKINISYDNGKISVNGHLFTSPVPIEKWVKALGTYSRCRGKETTSPAYYWDESGIMVSTGDLGKGMGLITAVNIHFTHEKDEIYELQLRKKDPFRVPDKVFSGTLILNGVRVNKDTRFWEYNHDTKGDLLRRSYQSYLLEFSGMLAGGVYEYSAEAFRLPDGTFRRISFEYVDIEAWKKINEYKKKFRKIDPDKVKVEYDGGKITVNGKMFAGPVTIQEWVKALGPYSRYYEKETDFIYYYWDNLGITLLAPGGDEAKKNLVDTIFLYFDREDEYYDVRKTDPERPPGTIFLGTLIFNGVNVDWRTKVKEYNSKTNGERLKRLYDAKHYGYCGELAGGEYLYHVEGSLASDESLEELKLSYINIKEMNNFAETLNRLMKESETEE